MGKYYATAGATLATQCVSCEAGKYNGVVAASTCTKCPVGTWSAAVGASTLSTCNLCLDSSAKLESGSFALGNYAPAGSTSVSACVNTRSTCSNVPMGAEMLLDQYLTCGSACTRSCTAATQMLTGMCKDDGTGTLCIDCTGTCRMDMKFTTVLYMAAADLTADKTSLFMQAINVSLGVPMPAVSIVSITENAVQVASKTISVVTKISLANSKGATLLSSNPVFTYSSLKSQLITNRFTSVVDSVDFADVNRFGTHFTDKGTMLAITQSIYEKVEGIISNSTDEVQMSVQMPYSIATFNEIAQVCM